MYQQLVTPNLDPTVYQDGAVLNDWYGWCYAVAWTAFGGVDRNPTAWAAWQATSYKHLDRIPPAGVYVPIWFSGYGGAGHVAIYKDGTVWSSPYTHKPYMDVLSSIAQVEQYYGVTYEGWSEDIGGVRVIEQVSAPAQGGDMVPDIKHLDEIFQRFFGRNSTADEQAAWIGKKSYTELLDTLTTQPGYFDQVKVSEVGTVALSDKWEQQIYDLQAKLKSVPSGAIDSATKTELDQTSQDVSWIRALLNKVFK